jgi:hypothetical protein
VKKDEADIRAEFESAPKLNGAAQPDDRDWDLTSLRLDQSFDGIIGAQPVIATVNVRKPLAQEWFRVHPEEAWRLQTTILALKEEREFFLVHPTLRSELWQEIQPILLCTAISRQSAFFLWPVRLPKGDGKKDRYIETDLAALKQAESKWTRRFWVPELKMHKILVAKQLTDEPVWPTDVDFQEIVKIAFKDRYITNLEHPALKQLRGEI